MKRDSNGLFAKHTDDDYVCSTWFERGRKNITLETRNGRLIFCLWDDEVDDAIESGYLDTPRLASMSRCTNVEWKPFAIAYARTLGLID